MNESARPNIVPDAAGNREEGRAFNPKFGADGLATCVAIDAARGDVLMVAHMNEAALRATLATGIVHYWSRSRGALWRKGDTSGQTQTLVEMRVDCDQDAFLAFVTVAGDGGACHTGRRSCFYRRVETDGGGGPARLHRTLGARRMMAGRDNLSGAVAGPSDRNHVTLILWRFVARKFRFPRGSGLRGYSDELDDVQGGLSQN